MQRAVGGGKQYDAYTEWTFEAGLKEGKVCGFYFTGFCGVGAGGNRTRYQDGIYYKYMTRGGL